MVNFKYYNTGASFDSTSLLTDDIAFVEDSNSLFTHGKEYKFITDAILNTKQDALTFNTTPTSSNKVATMADVPTAPSNLVCFSNDSGEGVVPAGDIIAGIINVSEEGFYIIDENYNIGGYENAQGGNIINSGGSSSGISYSVI